MHIPSRRILLTCFWLFLAGCEPEATPFPVDIPTASPLAVTADPIRYALAANTAHTVADMNILQRNAQITTLTQPINPADLGTRFEIIAAYGTYTDATQSPTNIKYTLVINNGLPPLESIADILLRGVDPAIIAAMLDIPGAQPFSSTNTWPQATLRTELANAGWPDGIDLLLAHNQSLGVEALVAYFARSGIRLNPVLEQEGPIDSHLALVTWASDDERLGWAGWAGDDNLMIDLFILPISYWAIPDLTITYSPQGWPVPARP